MSPSLRLLRLLMRQGHRVMLILAVTVWAVAVARARVVLVAAVQMEEGLRQAVAQDHIAARRKGVPRKEIVAVRALVVDVSLGIHE